MAARLRPAVLCILDGWGHRTDPSFNDILDARTPNYDRLIATCPQGLIDASESFVGLPKGQMGNSEVGHLNLGAGRVVMQDMVRISESIRDRSFFDNPAFVSACDAATKSNGTLHLVGLIGSGGVHAIDTHLFALIDLAA